MKHIKEEQINWVCSDCGNKYGDMPKGHIATWHNNFCDICGEEKGVTQPRDFGYLKRYKGK